MAYIAPPLIAATLWLAALAHAAPTGTVFTADERAGSISAVALATGQIRSIATGIMPHNLQVSSNGKQLLVVGMAPSAHAHHGDKGQDTGQMLVFDLSAWDAAPQTIPLGPHPAHVVTDLTGEIAYVTESAKNQVLVVDLVARQVVQTIAVGAYPHGLRLSPDGSLLYVANLQGGSVSVVDTKIRKSVATIRVGKSPVQVAVAADGHAVYVSLAAENSVGVIDTATRTLRHKIAVGRFPVQLFTTPDSAVLVVANQGTSKQPDQRVSIIDTRRGKVRATVVTGRGAHGVAVNSDGQYAFITNVESNTVSVIDLRTDTVIANHPVGNGPNGITYNPEKVTP